MGDPRTLGIVGWLWGTLKRTEVPAPILVVVPIERRRSCPRKMVCWSLPVCYCMAGRLNLLEWTPNGGCRLLLLE